MTLFSNPELIRHWRAQMRPRKMLAITVITYTLLAVVIYSASSGSPTIRWAQDLTPVILGVQFMALTIWGSLSFVQSVHRERDLNTFDFQRITRLTPDQLIFGKLLGVPVVPMFIFAILLPAQLYIAWLGKFSMSFVLASLLVLVVGSVALHSWSLVLSLFQRGNSSITAIGSLMLLGVAAGSGLMFRSGWSLAEVSPTFAFRLIEESSWNVEELSMKPTHLYGPGPVYDIIFGHPVHHFYVLMVLLITLIAWAWLVLRRNLKRDASVQQIFSPLQALLFCIYFDSIVLAFYSWRNGPAWEHHYVLLTAVMAPVGVLTLSLLRNREELRIHMASSGDAQPNHLLEATWPASFVLLGLLPAGTLVLMLAEQLGRIDTLPGNLAWGLLKLLMLAFWLMRDVAYLQWSALRRGRHSLLMGVIYLLVFYLASLIFVSVAFDGKGYQFHIFSAILGPISLAYRDTTLPPDAPWFFSLLVQVVLLGLFCFLQGGAIREIFSGLSSVLEPAASSDTKGQ